ncbi:MAG: ABC transporter ATP-binding protein [Acidimicrobiales bacterium]
MAEPLFRFEDVAVTVPGATVLEGVTAEVPGRGVTVVAGPSGAGKSTLLRLCNRLEVPSAGRVVLRGDDVAGLDPLALRRQVGMVFQRPALFGGTVRDNLAVAKPGAGDGVWATALEQAALAPSFLDRRAADLSGGEAQRVALARTLVTGPEVLLLDEPTSWLDAGPRRTFERLARGLAEGGVAVLWVTHDLAQLRRLADHVVVLDHGRLVLAGEPEGIDAPQVAHILSGGDGAR